MKDRLVGALHTAVSNFNECGDPTKSVVKAAVAADFNTDQTSRLVEMFNTARTLYHFKKASDRTESFELADPARVLSSMFETTPEVKQAAAYHLDDTSAYSTPERSYIDAPAPTIKSAEAPNACEGMTLEVTTSTILSEVQATRDIAKTAADEADIAGHSAGMYLGKVANTLVRGMYDPDGEKYARLYAGYGEQEAFAPVLAKLAEFVAEKDKPDAGTMRKFASQRVIDDSDLREQVSLLSEARRWMEVEAELKAASIVLEKEAADLHRALLVAVNLEPQEKTAEETLTGFFTCDFVKRATRTSTSTWDTVDPITGRKVEHKDIQDGKPPEPVPPGMGEGIRGYVKDRVSQLGGGPSALDAYVERAFSGPKERENKALSERLKNVQRGIMLQDLMTTDPVLSDADPGAVAQAYETMLQLSPHTASNKEVVRAWLRQSVHSVATSPYDAEQLTKLEKNIVGNTAGFSGGSDPKPYLAQKA